MRPDAAFRVCEQVTRSSGTSFSLGIRMLPRDQRRALCAVYALARRIDDIADGPLPAAAKREALTRVERDLCRLDRTRHADPVLCAVADAAERFPVPLDAFGDLIRGARTDVDGVRFETVEELVDYCRCVAGSIGRLALGVFAPADAPPTAWPRADDLGVALQLTNILRDIPEDLAAGRLYVPLDDIAVNRCEYRNGMLQGDVARLIRFEADRAQGWFRSGWQLLPMLDRRAGACVRAMAGVYAHLLRRIEQDPAAALEQRVALPRWERCWIAASGLARAVR